MAAAFSTDLRLRVLAAIDAGGKTAQVARQFDIDRTIIYDWIKRRDELGHAQPIEGKTGRPPVLRHRSDELRALIAANPDVTLEELRVLLNTTVSLTTIWRQLDELKITLKKSHSRI